MNTGVIEQTAGQVRGKPSAARAWLKAIELTSRIETLPGRLFADVVGDWARRQGERVALVSDKEGFDYPALARRITRYSRWARSVGVRKGDTVGLLMPNRPDYVACWLG